MDNHFIVNIFTPEKMVGQNLPAASLFIPSVNGRMNVLPDHTHIIAQLGTGELLLFGGSDDSDRYFCITHGICKILKKEVVVLATNAEESKDIDAERAKKSLQNAQDILTSGKNLSDEEIEKYRRKIERANLRLQMAKRQ